MVRQYWIPSMWLLSVPMYIFAGARPDRYALDVLGTRPEYPVTGVVEFAALGAIESLILYAIIRPKTFRCSWSRALGALSLFVPWLVVSLVLVMHAPPYVAAHAMWVLLVDIVLGGILVVSLVGALRGRRATGGAGRPGSASPTS